jgi:hypothetical protein
MPKETLPKGFVQQWIQSEIEAHSDCPVVKAISDHSEKNELVEAKLLESLKTLAADQSWGEE